MEIEGIINHALAALKVKNDAIERDRLFCESELKRWNDIREIHSNEEIQTALDGIDHIAKLVSHTEHMKYFISQEPTNMFMFKGFRIADIDYYLSLRQFCED